MNLQEIYNNIEGAARDMMSTRIALRNRIQSFNPEIQRLSAKLGERKTVHEWLNQLGVPDKEETGKQMCLLRRLAVALKFQPHKAEDSQ